LIYYIARSVVHITVYPTGGHYIRYAKTFEDLMTILRKAREDFSDTLKYVIVQPMLIATTEKKLVYLNGKFSHITSGYSKTGASLGDEERLIEFADRVVETLKLALGPPVTI